MTRDEILALLQEKADLWTDHGEDGINPFFMNDVADALSARAREAEARAERLAQRMTDQAIIDSAFSGDGA